MLCSGGLGDRVRQIVEEKCKSRIVTAIFVCIVVLLQLFLVLHMGNLMLFQPKDVIWFGIELPFYLP
jgi:hypothetical protein